VTQAKYSTISFYSQYSRNGSSFNGDSVDILKHLGISFDYKYDK